MKLIGHPITGAQYSSHHADEQGSSPEAALEQFYAAFNGRDLALMANNWAQSDEIALDNPLGGIRRGWAEIHPAQLSGTCRLSTRSNFGERKCQKQTPDSWAPSPSYMTAISVR